VESSLVLVVDDEASLRHLIQRKLKSKGYETQSAESAEEALLLVRATPPAVVLLDIVLPGMSGMDGLTRIKEISPDSEVVLMTSHASLETALRAIREGAYDYLQKPFEDIEDVSIIVGRAMERRRLTLNNRVLLKEKEQRNRELADAVARLTSMVEAARVMSESRSVHELAEFFVRFISERLKVNRVSLMLVNESSRTLRIVAHRGLDELDTERVEVELGEGIAGRVAETGQAWLVTDMEADERASAYRKKDLANSFISAPIVLSLPLKSSQRIVGVVNLTNREDNQTFGQEDLNYLHALSSQLALAIDRTRQFEELDHAYASLKATQEQLLFSERLKATGQLAAGVAHDVNNVLSIVLGKVQLAKIALECGQRHSKVARDLNTVIKTVNQGAAIIKRIQDHCKSDTEQAEVVVDLNRIVREAVEMTRPKWKEESGAQNRTIRIEYELGEIESVSGNLHEITQVVGNLIFNAVEAMPGGGSLIFRTYGEEHWTVLEVEDTGLGMDEKTLARIFEPFFTTKEHGQGLGTSILHEIVKRHGGKIAVRSATGQGTTFTVCLPAMGTRDESPPPVALPEVTTRDFGRILLVDDEDLVRETYEEALQTQGHEILTSSCGSDALKLLDSNSVDLLITDLSMDGMSGVELARLFKKRFPDVPVILLSGWAESYVSEKINDVGVDYVLQKPCMIDRLLDTVQEALQQPAPVSR